MTERTTLERDLEERCGGNSNARRNKSSRRLAAERQLREEAEQRRQAAEQESQMKLQEITSAVQVQIHQERQRRSETEMRVQVERQQLEEERAALAQAFKAMENKLKMDMQAQIQDAVLSANQEKVRRLELEQKVASEHQFLEKIKTEQMETASRLAQTEADLMQAQLLATEERETRAKLESFYGNEKQRLESEFSSQAQRLHQQNAARLAEAARQLEEEKARADDERRKRAEGERRLMDIEAQIGREKATSVAQINEIAQERLRLAAEQAQIELNKTRSQLEIEDIRRNLEAEREIIELERMLQEEQAAAAASSKLDDLAAQLQVEAQHKHQREADERAAAARLEQIQEETRRAEASMQEQAARTLNELEQTLEVQRRHLGEGAAKQATLVRRATRDMHRLSFLKDEESKLLQQLFPDQDGDAAKPPMLKQAHGSGQGSRASLNPFLESDDDSDDGHDEALQQAVAAKNASESLTQELLLKEDDFYEETLQLTELFGTARLQYQAEARRRLEIELELEEQRLSQATREFERDEELEQLRRDKEKLQRELRLASQRQQGPPQPAPAVQRMAQPKTVIAFSPFGPDLSSTQFGKPGGPKLIPQKGGPRPIPPKPEPAPVVQLPVVEEPEVREVLLTPEQRKEAARTTLRRLAREKAFSKLDVNFLTLAQELMHPQPVPPEVLVERIDVAGYLWKKGDVRRNWKRRFFVLSLEERSLAYFTDAEQHTLKGIIYLDQIRSVPEPDDAESRGKFAFLIVTPDRTYPVRAESALAAKMWVSLLAPMATDK